MLSPVSRPGTWKDFPSSTFVFTTFYNITVCTASITCISQRCLVRADVNIELLSTPERRRDEFLGDFNSKIAETASNWALQHVPSTAKWTLALHTPEQRLNATAVVESLSNKGMLGTACATRVCYVITYMCWS